MTILVLNSGMKGRQYVFLPGILGLRFKKQKIHEYLTFLDVETIVKLVYLASFLNKFHRYYTL